MKSCMITFRSVTPAQRGEGLLRRTGMDCSIQRTPRWMEEQGCGYSLRIRCQDVMPALEILRANDVCLAAQGNKAKNIKISENSS